MKVVEAMPSEHILFVPDRNLARFVAEQVPEKNIIPWEGFCYVHQQITPHEVAEQTGIFTRRGIERVAEVTFGQLQSGRFRHGVRLVRWRPDRTPDSCTYEQLDVADPVRFDELFATGPNGFIEVFSRYGVSLTLCSAFAYAKSRP